MAARSDGRTVLCACCGKRIPLIYGCARSRLPEALAAKFLQLDCDGATSSYFTEQQLEDVTKLLSLPKGEAGSCRLQRDSPAVGSAEISPDWGSVFKS